MIWYVGEADWVGAGHATVGKGREGRESKGRGRREQGKARGRRGRAGEGGEGQRREGKGSGERGSNHSPVPDSEQVVPVFQVDCCSRKVGNFCVACVLLSCYFLMIDHHSTSSLFCFGMRQ